jgi:hypothetical protein
MAGRHSPDRRHNDSYAGVMDTARAARHRSSRVGRRAETRPKTSRCLKEKETKGGGGYVRPGFSPIIDARKRPRSRRRSRVRRFRLIPQTSRQPRMVRKVRVGVAPPTREFRSHADSCPQYGETRTRTGDTTIFSRAVRDGRTHAVPGTMRFSGGQSSSVKSAITSFCTEFRRWRRLISFFADAWSGVAAPVLTRTTSAWASLSSLTRC